MKWTTIIIIVITSVENTGILNQTKEQDGSQQRANLDSHTPHYQCRIFIAVRVKLNDYHHLDVGREGADGYVDYHLEGGRKGGREEERERSGK